MCNSFQKRIPSNYRWKFCRKSRHLRKKYFNKQETNLHLSLPKKWKNPPKLTCLIRLTFPSANNINFIRWNKMLKICGSIARSWNTNKRLSKGINSTTYQLWLHRLWTSVTDFWLPHRNSKNWEWRHLVISLFRWRRRRRDQERFFQRVVVGLTCLKGPRPR
jgi:hypothetical protein